MTKNTKDKSGGNKNPSYPLRATVEEFAAWRKKAGKSPLSQYIRKVMNAAPPAKKDTGRP